ncbi:hypothetical protein BN938_2163 [Mucinivorans hirudinis]|uniref:Fimbrillin family protein n=1 Tax=Mucinivorans hirudinis TaxID=1433126 RepID=A0A060R9D9_9BACT|nr:hypothetical protein BN938_2163 [Mucinivorans hirudinis]
MKKYLIFATLVAMVFVGCKKNTTAPPKKPADNRVEAQFSGKIIKDDVKTTTRVTSDGRWHGSELIGVYMLSTESREIGAVLVHNSKTAITRGTNRLRYLDSPIFFPANNTEVDFIAYYPYSTALSDKKRSAIPADFSNQGNLENLEFLWAFVPKQSSKSPRIHFPFRRLQSSINIELVSNSKHITAELIKKAKIKITQVPVYAVFDIMKGAIEHPAEATDLLVNKNNPVTYLPPHTNEKFKDRKIIVEIPYEDKTLRFTAPITFDVVAGKTHLVTLGLGDLNEVSVSSTIEPWWRGEWQNDILPVRLK